MAEQLTFDLAARPALGREDFFISPSNAVAVDVIQTWHDWPQGKLVLVGPHGAGKTHLAHVWAAMCDARVIAAADLPGLPVQDLARAAVAVEDADRIAGDRDAEEALFHLHNLALAEGAPLLLTASAPPVRWELGLPDLASRMQGTAIATLQPPDDTLLAAVLVKLFADRQLQVEAGVVAWLTKHMDRSFAAAGAVVEAIDAAALRQRKTITQRFAARVLDNMSQGAP